jgi:hypothetical protein
MTGGKAGSMSGNQLAGMRSALGLDESEMAIVAGRGVELWRKLEARGDLAAGDTADDAFLRVLWLAVIERDAIDCYNAGRRAWGLVMSEGHRAARCCLLNWALAPRGSHV